MERDGESMQRARDWGEGAASWTSVVSLDREIMRENAERGSKRWLSADARRPAGALRTRASGPCAVRAARAAEVCEYKGGSSYCFHFQTTSSVMWARAQTCICGVGLVAAVGAAAALPRLAARGGALLSPGVSAGACASGRGPAAALLRALAVPRYHEANAHNTWTVHDWWLMIDDWWSTISVHLFSVLYETCC